MNVTDLFQEIYNLLDKQPDYIDQITVLKALLAAVEYQYSAEMTAEQTRMLMSQMYGQQSTMDA
jgi:hypothetical protein